MKIVKWLIFIIIVAVGYFIASDMASPYIRISSDETQETFGSTINFTVDITNVSPRPKEINISAGEDADVVILVDKAEPAKQIKKQDAEKTITLAPFATQTIKRSVMLTPAAGDRKEPQKLLTDTTILPVIAGQHAVRATWGGHTSAEYTFGVR